MLLITHLVFALSSVAYTTVLWFKPASTNFKPAYILIVGTLVSGTILVWQTHSNLLSACMSGLVYLVLVSFGLFMAKYKLAVKERRIDEK
jgi:uncharacterized membrane protein YfcA